MSGQWSGGIANRYWQRPGNRNMNVAGDRERSHRLYGALAGERFWCDVCGGTHRLAEIRECREANPFMTAFKSG